MDGLRVLRAWVLFAVPFGFGLLMIRVVQPVVMDIADLRAGRPPRPARQLFD